jgi:hypothetical protein
MTKFLMAAIAATLALLGTMAQAADDKTVVAIASPATTAAPATDPIENIKQQLLSADWIIILYNLPGGGRQEATFKDDGGQLKLIIKFRGSTETMSVAISPDGTVQYAYASGFEVKLSFNQKEQSFSGTSWNRSTNRPGVDVAMKKA